MRIRTDSVFISSVLFTIAMLSLIPLFWSHLLTERDEIWLAKLDVGYRGQAQTMSDLGVACLAIILIGLIVTWTGYRCRERWTWLVMFIVVWVWAFPLLVLPLFKGRFVVTFSEFLYAAIYRPGSPRIWGESALIFLLMVIALLLPIKSFFFVRKIQEPGQRLSPRLIGFSVMGALVAVIALFTWIRVGVLYEIPLSDVNSALFPVPPPPPPPCNSQ